MENKAFDRTDEDPVSTNPEKKNGRSLSPPAKPETSVAESESELIYKINDVPPWQICILLGLQHYLTAFGGNLMLPIIVANSVFCMNGDSLGISELISTTFFISGLSTLLQTTFGCRLPITQGASFSFLAPAIMLFSLQKWKCPYTGDLPVNNTLPEVGSEGHREIWQLRLREVNNFYIYIYF
ncbi:Solute carrier family 23 member 1,Solute carrier family 23 member 2 [Acanthosepion pharaonis]|uniref:Solute carrier family 23 member 1,Solute carrier family 23 member 2 n=1 Tax=Acanthosepion pharaonis TaxID=158019 RepID=A0A812E1N3_ACAPH|nr:Solute carrier family 23 member 1,Solute carrier family 23 member 2 [Sepia pharaonis]